MVMAGAVLGLGVDGVVVRDPGTVAKTLPDFLDRWSGLLDEPAGAVR
jgi:3-phosphoshikimate 1-carboxyvinyltransferase